MITLLAASGETAAIEWDETKTKLSDQTTEAQAFVQENILDTDSVDTNETIHSVVQDVDWSRIKSQLYTTDAFTLDVIRTYKGVESCAVASAAYTLAVV